LRENLSTASRAEASSEGEMRAANLALAEWKRFQIILAPTFLDKFFWRAQS
jgi:hypothetical protein